MELNTNIVSAVLNAETLKLIQQNTNVYAAIEIYEKILTKS